MSDAFGGLLVEPPQFGGYTVEAPTRRRGAGSIEYTRDRDEDASVEEEKEEEAPAAPAAFLETADLSSLLAPLLWAPPSLEDLEMRAMDQDRINGLISGLMAPQQAPDDAQAIQLLRQYLG